MVCWFGTAWLVPVPRCRELSQPQQGPRSAKIYRRTCDPPKQPSPWPPRRGIRAKQDFEPKEAFYLLSTASFSPLPISLHCLFLDTASSLLSLSVSLRPRSLQCLFLSTLSIYSTCSYSLSLCLLLLLLFLLILILFNSQPSFPPSQSTSSSYIIIIIILVI